MRRPPTSLSRPPSSRGPTFLERPRPRAGIALVLVLLSLAFITALTLAFFLSTTTELQSSKSYSDGSSAQLLADGAVNLVTAQIQNATVVPVNPDPADPSNAGIAWVSQPGLLRTFDNGGNPLKSYKLYSSGDMIVDGSFDPLAASAQEVPADWSKRPAQFTDLNAPVVKRDKTGAFTSLYPIVDGNALTLATPDGGLTYDADDANGQPAPDGLPDLQGFSVRNAPLAAASSVSAVNPVPMPVRWLYQLRDGTLASLDDTGKLRTNKASVSNPVVARMAFWTDDESCKVNINTSAGDEWNDQTNFGSYFDIPHASTVQDQKLGKFQPAQHEFQRYPGHPATTYLSAVFPDLTRLDIANLVPRVDYQGSSRGGTQSASGVMSTDVDRLYATVDELQFKKDRDKTVVGAANSGGTGTRTLRPARIERAKFFLSAHSRSPELNLFNQPRVTIWPIAASTSARTAFEQQMAFCSTVGEGNGRAYYFVRGNPNSKSDDYNNQPRNQAVYAYLQGLLQRPVPGFGGQMLANYPADRDQILTEIFDYIRCTNLLDLTGTPFTPKPPLYQLLSAAPPGSGHVIPIEINGTRGFGRSSTIYSPGIQFYATEVSNRYIKKMGAVFLMQTFGVADGVARYEPSLTFEVEGLENLKIDDGVVFPSGSRRLAYDSYSTYDENGSGNTQGVANLFWRYDTITKQRYPRDLGTGPNDYPFFSAIKDVTKHMEPLSNDPYPQPPDTFRFSGGQVKVRVYSPGNELLQSFVYEFPPATINPPFLPEGNYYGDYSRNYFESRTYYGVSYGHNQGRTPSITIDGDYFRALEPVTGDMRLVMASTSIPAAAYRAHERYSVITESRADGFRANNGFSYGGSWGKLVAAVNYDNRVTANNSALGPCVPSFLNNSPKPGANLLGSDGQLYPGDWDTGMGDLPDGSLINKPTEGESGNTPYFTYDNAPAGVTLFSPNRQIPSAVTFGSLSTGVKASQNAFAGGGNLRPWQTLLFSPNPAAGDKHPGFGQPAVGPPGPKAQPPYSRPPDHLLLDLFTMPVVEPYAISEPFSTAGKINLNYQIAPFTYLNRKTGLEAVLRSVWLTAIPTGDGLKYKGYFGNPDPNAKYRLPLNLEETLRPFDERFQANAPFRSASQICEMFLVPQGQSASGVAGWWSGYQLTGDNLREKPYADLYGRLTTRSNTFTVHVRVQTLQKVRNDPQQDTWKEDRDQVTGEYRGSVTLERYLDPNDPRFTSLAADRINPDTQSVNPAYRFRTLNTKQFAP